MDTEGRHRRIKRTKAITKPRYSRSRAKGRRIAMYA